MSYANTAVLLPCKTAGTDFSDFSRHNRTVQVYGGAAINSDQPNKYDNSFDHDGASPTHLEIPGINLSTGATATTVGARDCTIEFWLRPAADGTRLRLGGYGVPGSSSGATVAQYQGLIVYRDAADNKIHIDAGNLNRDGVGGFYGHASTSTVLAGVWTHVRVVISSNVVTLALNGTADTLVNKNGSWQTDLSNCAVYIPTNWEIGSNNLHNNANAGGSTGTFISAAFFMDDYRLSYEALTTGGFTPPAKSIAPVAGTITDDTGTAVERRVWVIPRVAAPTQVFGGLSDSGDGTYSIDAPDVECARVVLDDDAGTQYNDLIDRVAVAI